MRRLTGRQWIIVAWGLYILLAPLVWREPPPPRVVPLWTFLAFLAALAALVGVLYLLAPRQPVAWAELSPAEQRLARTLSRVCTLLMALALAPPVARGFLSGEVVLDTAWTRVVSLVAMLAMLACMFVGAGAAPTTSQGLRAAESLTVLSWLVALVALAQGLRHGVDLVVLASHPRYSDLIGKPAPLLVLALVVWLVTTAVAGAGLPHHRAWARLWVLHAAAVQLFFDVVFPAMRGALVPRLAAALDALRGGDVYGALPIVPFATALTALIVLLHPSVARGFPPPGRRMRTTTALVAITYVALWFVHSTQPGAAPRTAPAVDPFHATPRIPPAESWMMLPPLIDADHADVGAAPEHWCAYGEYASEDDCRRERSRLLAGRAHSVDGFAFFAARCIPAADVGRPPREARIRVTLEQALRRAVANRGRVGRPDAIRGMAVTPPPSLIVMEATEDGRGDVLTLAIDVVRADATADPDMVAARARAGVPEYWVVLPGDPRLTAGSISAWSRPSPADGRYDHLESVYRNQNQHVELASLGIRIAVDDLLPPICP